MFNTINLLGNLGNNPTLRYFDDGTAVCNLGVLAYPPIWYISKISLE